MLDGEASFGAPPTVLTLTDDSFWGLSAAGASGNASTFSADGQLIAFESEAGNLTTNDFNGLQDIFVRDLGTGDVTLISAALEGTSGNGASFNPILSADGRYILFESEASNLVAGDTNNLRDVFLFDLLTNTTTLVSVGLGGTPASNTSFAQSISADGSVVVFASAANNLVGQPTGNQRQVFARDITQQTTTLVSINSAGTAGANGPSAAPNRAVLSPDGRFVAFDSTATDVIANDLNGIFSDVYLRDLQLGTTTLVSVNRDGTGSGNHQSTHPVFDSTGRYIAFESKAVNLTAGNPPQDQIYIRDTQLHTTTLVSIDDTFDLTPPSASKNPVFSPDGRYLAYEGSLNSLTTEIYARDLISNTTLLISANRFSDEVEDHISDGHSLRPVFSPDGQTVYFESTGTILLENVTSGISQIYARNLADKTTSLVSVQIGGAPGNGASSRPLLSPDGSLLVFQSAASGLVADDNNRQQDLFVLDVTANEFSLLSNRHSSMPLESTSRTSATDTRLPTGMSDDGRYVVFLSDAQDLVPNAVFGRNVFRHDRQTGTTELVSVNPDGTGGSPGQVASGTTAISADGRYVVFGSPVLAMVPGLQFAPGLPGGPRGIFVRDMQLGTTRAVNLNTAGQVAGLAGERFTISPNGRYVAFATNQPLLPVDTNGVSDVYVFDLQSNTLSLDSVSTGGVPGNALSTVLAPTAVGEGHNIFSDDGRFLLFTSSANNLTAAGGASDALYVRDLQSGTTALVSVNASGNPASTFGHSISGDGSLVSFVTNAQVLSQDTNSQFDVYLRNLATATTTMPSAAQALGGFSPTLGRDAGSIVFETSLGGTISLLLYNIADGTTRTIHSGTDVNYFPTISADGRYVAFLNTDATLAESDTNGASDVFLYDLQADVLMLASGNLSGTSTGNRGAALAPPLIDAAGSVVVFAGNAFDLAPADVNGRPDIFAFSRPLGAGAIAGEVYADINGNGQRDGGEGPLVGWQVFLDHNLDSERDDNEEQIFTNASGQFLFAGLQPGSYRIVAEQRAGFSPTVPLAGFLAATIVADEMISGLRFGYQQEFVDLAVQSVFAPLTGAPGRNITVDWTIVNEGELNALGSWQDAVYLSTDQVLDASDLLLGTMSHTGGLAAGDFYDGSLTATLPAVLPGEYFVLVQTDRRGQVQQDDRSNDLLASGTATELSLPELFIDVPVLDAFSEGERHYYQISPPSGRSMEIFLNTLVDGGAVAVYVSRLSLPTPGSFDFRGQSFEPDARLIVPQTVPNGTYYVLVEGQYGDAALNNYTLTAQLPGLKIAEVSPNEGGNTGRVTVRIDGTDFSPNTIVQLYNDTTVIDTVAIDFRDPTLIYATFDLTGQSAGQYNVWIEDGAFADAALDAFRVVNGVESPLELDLIVPANYRPGRPTPIIVEVKNISNTDVEVPLLFLSSEDATIRLVNKSGDSGPMAGFLATSSDGPAGVLRPGQVSRVSLSFISSETSGQGAQIAFSLDQPLDLNQAIEWDSLKADSQPMFMPDEAWDVIWDRYTTSVGTTLGDYQRMLIDNANYLGALGINTFDVQRLSAMTMSQANNAMVGTVSISEEDLFVDAPGFPLSFTRINLPSIAGHYRVGALGYGWTHNWEISARTDTLGNVAIESGGGVEVFALQPDGSYLGERSSQSQLSLVGGAYQLRLVNGELLRFRADGKLDSIEDPNGNRITANYDAAGLLTAIAHSSGTAIAFVYNAQGRLIEVTSSTGQLATYTYDAGDEHLASATTTAGTVAYEYELGANLAARHALSAVTATDGKDVTYAYDSEGRVVSVTREGGIDGTTIAYGQYGEVTFTDATGVSTTVFFNDAGQTELVRDALGRSVAFDYDVNGLLASRTVGDLATTFYTFCGCGSLTSTVDSLGHQVSLSYDPVFRQLTEVVDARGNRTSFAIDDRGNIVSASYADGSTEHVYYDAAGNITDSVSRNGDEIHYDYDERGLLTGITFSGGTQQLFTYDDSGNLLTAADDNGTVEMQYNSAGQLTRVDYPTGRFIEYVYDPSGKQTSANQNGFIVHYAYDANGRLYELTDDTAALLARYEYGAAGRLLRKELGNGTFTTYAFDAAGSLSSLVNHTSLGDINSRFDYTYDNLGRLISMETLDGVTNYGYDLSGQLTSVELPTGRTITYEYDPAGNRVKVVDDGNETAYVANNLNQYTSVGTVTYEYDANGNLQTRTDGSGTTTYSYNPLNQLISISGPDGTFVYEYDALGQRSAVTANGERRELMYDPAYFGTLLGEFDDEGNLLANYAYGLGLVGQFDSAESYYYDFDHLGSTTGLTDSSGSYVNLYTYLPFGETNVVSEAVPNPFRYVGEFGVLDRGDGLLDMRMRQYDPAVGQFTSEDPIGFGGNDPNLRRYVGNAPTQFIDPVGLNGANTGSGGTVPINIPPQQFLPDADPVEFKTFKVRGCTTDPKTGRIIKVFEQWIENSIQVYREIVDGFVEQGLRDSEELRSNLRQNFSARGGYRAPALQYIGVLKKKLISKLKEVALTHGRQGGFVYEACGEITAIAADELIWKKALGAATRKLERMTIGIISLDPNDITGPGGFGTANFVQPDQLFPYTVRFENDPEQATAPAQEVFITHQVDADLDWTTFELGEIGFGSVVISVPGGLKEYSTQVAFQNQDGSPLRVDVHAEFDLATGVATWKFLSVDPITGTFPRGAFDGFLPVNDDAGRGEGFVRFMVRDLPGLATGSTIGAQASIVFDFNEPILTNTFTNSIDDGPPASSVTTLPAETSEATFEVSWTGVDDFDGLPGSGIATFDIFVSVNGFAFTLWLDDTSDLSALYDGEVGSSYAFYSMATDGVGHVEADRGAADTVTLVVPPVVVDPPQVAGTMVQPGLTQRSYVDLLWIDFSAEMNLGELISNGSIVDAVGLVNLGIHVANDADQVIPLSPDQFRYEFSAEQGISRLTWSLDEFTAGKTTLSDGYYQLTLDSSVITDVDGNALDGNADHIAGDNFLMEFHRLEGDVNGDRIIDGDDMLLVNGALGSHPGWANWNPDADLDRSGVVNVLDRLMVARADGQQITPPAPAPQFSGEGGLLATGFSSYWMSSALLLETATNQEIASMQESVAAIAEAVSLAMTSSPAPASASSSLEAEVGDGLYRDLAAGLTSVRVFSNGNPAKPDGTDGGLLPGEKVLASASLFPDATAVALAEEALIEKAADYWFAHDEQDSVIDDLFEIWGWQERTDAADITGNN